MVSDQVWCGLKFLGLCLCDQQVHANPPFLSDVGLKLKGKQSDVFSAFQPPGLTTGMAASALNHNGLTVMNR